MSGAMNRRPYSRINYVQEISILGELRGVSE